MTLFKIIDRKTGKEPTERVIQNIAKRGNLIPCDIDGFYIDEYGQIILVDDCGNCTWLDMGRFKVEMQNEASPTGQKVGRRMQVVIDIPEKLVCEGFERPFTEEEKNTLIKAIGNGTSLPKGHERLIDADALLDTNSVKYREAKENLGSTYGSRQESEVKNESI